VQKQKAHSRAKHQSFPRAPQAQDKAPRQEGSKTASRAARNKKRLPAFANKCDAHRACRCGGIAECDERLAAFVCRTTAQRKNGSEVALALKANSAMRHLRRVRHVKAGPVETHRRGTSTTHIIHQHKSWANSGDSRGAEAQTKQPQERAPPPSSQGHAAAVAPAPRAAVNGPGGSDLLKRLAVGSWPLLKTKPFGWIAW